VYFVIKLAARPVISHYIAMGRGALFLLVSVLVAYFRPCKSLIMNLSFGYHLMLFGILEIDYELWREDFSFSTETLATMFVVLPAISHALILMWAGYKVTACVNCHMNVLGTALARSRLAALHLCRRHDYEELRDSLTHT